MQIAGASGVTAYTFVATNGTSGKVDTATEAVGVGQVALGVAVNTAAAGKEVSVVVSGFVEVDCLEAMVAGDKVATDTNGLAVKAATAGDHILGEYAPLPMGADMPDAVSGDRIRILLYQNKMTLHV